MVEKGEGVEPFEASHDSEGDVDILHVGPTCGTYAPEGRSEENMT